MVFISLSEILKDWTKKKKLNYLLEKEEILNKIKNYFYKIRKFNPKLIEVLEFKNGNLKIKCLKSIISHQIRLEEKEIKDYLFKNFKIKIKKIFYQL